MIPHPTTQTSSDMTREAGASHNTQKHEVSEESVSIFNKLPPTCQRSTLTRVLTEKRAD